MKNLSTLLLFIFGLFIASCTGEGESDGTNGDNSEKVDSTTCDHHHGDSKDCHKECCKDKENCPKYKEGHCKDKSSCEGKCKEKCKKDCDHKCSEKCDRDSTDTEGMCEEGMCEEGACEGAE